MKQDRQARVSFILWTGPTLVHILLVLFDSTPISIYTHKFSETFPSVNESTSYLLIEKSVQHIVTPSYEIYSNTLRAPDVIKRQTLVGASEGDFNGCPLLVGNTMLMFGGGNDQRQIAEIYSWGSFITRRIGSLLFQFRRGTCLYNNEMLYFCFGWDCKNVDRNSSLYGVHQCAPNVSSS